MPDHLHLLVRLSGSLDISRCVARFKAKTRATLSAAGLGWQPNFYEHRLRPDDDASTVLRYMLLNPTRNGLCPPDTDQDYPWCWLGLAEAEWFNPTTDDGKPFPESLK